MFNSVALEVVIGIVFIYLLYSLLATVLSEIFATYIGLRARNLKEAVDRMLNDEPADKSFLERLWDSFKLAKNPTNPRVTNFYNHPEIKYLGSTGIFKTPSQFKAISFSKTLLNMLNEIGYKKQNVGDTMMEDPKEGDIRKIPVTQITKERIDTALDGIISEHNEFSGEEKERIVVDEETAKYILGLWKESFGDLTKFRLLLETWFDRTMEQCTEWYKRKIQIVLLVLGFLIAWFFNADTFTIIRALSKDKDAREQMVRLADEYVKNNPPPAGQGTPGSNMDSLMEVRKKLNADIEQANSILGLGGWLPDTVWISNDPKTGHRIYSPRIDHASLSKEDQTKEVDKIGFAAADKWAYFFRLLLSHFFGFLITAIAISLGAPFWFDLLNKVMSLRTSVKQDTVTSGTTSPGTSPINRVA